MIVRQRGMFTDAGKVCREEYERWQGIQREREREKERERERERYRERDREGER